MAALDARRVRERIDTAASALNHPRQTSEVFARMKLRLSWKSQARTGVEERKRRAIDLVDVPKAGASRGAQLAIELIGGFARFSEEIALDALEVAVDVMVRGDLFDAIDGRGVAVGDHLRACRAVHALELAVEAVDLVREMGARVQRHAAADLAVFDDDDLAARLHQQVCRREAGDASPDNADFGGLVPVERQTLGHRHVTPGGLSGLCECAQRHRSSLCERTRDGSARAVPGRSTARRHARAQGGYEAVPSDGHVRATGRHEPMAKVRRNLSDIQAVSQPLPQGIPPERSVSMQIAALAGSFAVAILLGSLVGQLLQPQGEATTAVVTFALLLVFIGGLALWGAMAASIMARALFNGDFALALLRFFLRGKLRGDIPRLTLDRHTIVAAAARVVGWSRVFVWLAVAVAIVTAPISAWLATTGFARAMLLTAIVTISYGGALRALARGGYLFPPDVDA